MDRLSPVTPFAGRGRGRMLPLYLVPETHVLFVGPIDCARHHCRMHFLSERMSILTPSDTDFALGKTEDMILQAVGEIVSALSRPVRGILLLSGCQARMLSLDLDGICARITREYSLPAAHHEESRLCRIEGRSYELPGLLESLLDMLPPKGEKAGPTVLFGHCCPELDSALTANGTARLQSCFAWDSFDSFAALVSAPLCVVTRPDLEGAGKRLAQRWGAECLYLPISYRMEEIDAHYVQLGAYFGRTIQTEAKAAAEEKVAHTRETLKDSRLYLDLSHVARPWNLLRALVEYELHPARVSVGFAPPGVGRIASEELDRRAVLEVCPEIEIDTPQFPAAPPPEPKCPPDMAAIEKMGSQVPEEERFWGYSSVVKLMEYLETEGKGS